MNLDNIEFLSVKEQKTSFPKHYHETFCISLIHSGIEQINLEHQCIYIEKESISITNPYEIHSNPIIDSSSIIKFDTIYISKDLVKYIFNGQQIFFTNRKINNSKANLLFIQFKKALDSNDLFKIEQLLIQFLNILKYYSDEKKEEYTELNFKSLNNINTYIDNNITNKLNLEELSKVVNINKFGLAKKFKASTGISPMNYILMKKNIFKQKTYYTTF